MGRGVVNDTSKPMKKTVNWTDKEAGEVVVHDFSSTGAGGAPDP
jgi:hypothetical protein